MILISKTNKHVLSILILLLSSLDLIAQGEDSTRTYEMDPLVVTGTRITRQKNF